MLLLFTLLAFTGGYTETTFDAALKQAAQENKPVLIDFYTTWCPWCKVFDKEVEKDPELQALLNRVVFIKVNCESKDGAALARQYRITGYPSFTVLNPTDQKVHRTWHGYKKEAFFDYVNGAFVTKSEADLLAAYEAAPTPQEALRLGTQAISEGRLDDALRYLELAKKAGLKMGGDNPVETVFFQALSLARANPDQIPVAQLENLLARIVEDSVNDITRIYFTSLYLSAIHALDSVDVNAHLSNLVVWLRTSYETNRQQLLASGGDDKYFEGQWNYSRDQAALNMLVYTGLKEQAVEFYPTTLRDDWKDHSTSWNNWAWLSYELGVKLELAEERAKTGVELADNPKSKVAVLDTLAQIQMRLGKSGDAMDNIEAAIELDPTNSYLIRQKRKFTDIMDMQGEPELEPDGINL